MKKTIAILSCLFLIGTLFFTSNALANNYDVIGTSVPSGVGSIAIPLRHVNLPVVTAPYNEPRTSTGFHRGVDYQTIDGLGLFKQDVYPVKGGVIHATGTTTTTGNYIIVEHTGSFGGKFYSLYFHLDSFSVTSGSVTTSTVIGISGNTGGVDAHLHWELSTTNSDYVNYYRETFDPTGPMMVAHGTFWTWCLQHSFINWVSINSSRVVEAKISGNDGAGNRTHPTDARVYYKNNTATTWSFVTMTHTTNYMYQATLPYDPLATYVDYVIWGKSNDFSSNAYTYFEATYRHPHDNPNSMTSPPVTFRHYY